MKHARKKQEASGPTFVEEQPADRQAEGNTEAGTESPNRESEEIDLSKKYKTISGRDVELLEIRKHPHYPVVGIIHHLEGPSHAVWTSDGRTMQHVKGFIFDLVEV